MGKATSIIAIIAFLLYYQPESKIVFFCFLLICLIVMYSSNDKKILKSKEEHPNDQYLSTPSYLGGIPTFTSTSPEDVELYINNTIGQVEVFSTKDGISEIIPYIKIKSVTCETKESLSAARMLLFGIFAFALKAKNNYFKITYINDINEEANVIFEADSSPSLVQQITNARYNYIKTKQSLNSNAGQI